MSCGCDVSSAGYVRKYCSAHQAQIRVSQIAGDEQQANNEFRKEIIKLLVEIRDILKQR